MGLSALKAHLKGEKKGIISSGAGSCLPAHADAGWSHAGAPPRPPAAAQPRPPPVGTALVTAGRCQSPWGTAGRGARVAVGGATQSWGPRPAAVGFARESNAAAQPCLATTEPRVFRKGSSRKKKRERNSAKDLQSPRHAPAQSRFLERRSRRPAQQLAELRTGRSRPQMPRPAGQGPGRLRTLCISGGFLTALFPAFSRGRIFGIQRQLKERPSLQLPPCFGTEFCIWLKFFSFQNASGHFSWKPGIWPRKEAKCENTAENSMLFFHVVQPAPLAGAQTAEPQPWWTDRRVDGQTDGCIHRSFPITLRSVTKVHVNKTRPESRSKAPPSGAAQSSKERFAWPGGHGAVLGSRSAAAEQGHCHGSTPAGNSARKGKSERTRGLS